MCITCILIPLLIGLICALLGYLLGRELEKQKQLKEIDKIKLQLDASAIKLDDCILQSGRLQRTIDELKAKLDEARNAKKPPKQEPAPVAALPFDAALAYSVFQKRIVENDFKVIEGVGAKIEELFHAAGILTWQQLSELSVAQCQMILTGGGVGFQMHKPETWPRQAELAYLGKWQELKDWQDVLDGGTQ